MKEKAKILCSQISKVHDLNVSINKLLKWEYFKFEVSAVPLWVEGVLPNKT